MRKQGADHTKPTELRKAERQVGETLVEKARWLLQFVRAKLANLDESKWLDLRWQVRAFGLKRGHTTHTPASKQVVFELQGAVLKGLCDVSTSPGWNIIEDQTEHRLIEATWRRRKCLLLTSESPDTHTDRVIHAMRCLDAASEAGRLSRCARPGCGMFFVPTRRQVFCGQPCSSLVRWKRFIKKRTPRQIYEMRHKVYERRVKLVHPRAVVAKRGPRRNRGSTAPR